MRRPGVYILQSLKNGRYYIGSTAIVSTRLAQHNQGLVKATEFVRPLALRVFITCTSLKEARESEYRLKRYKNRAILEKVIQDSIFPWEHQAGP